MKIQSVIHWLIFGAFLACWVTIPALAQEKEPTTGEEPNDVLPEEAVEGDVSGTGDEDSSSVEGDSDIEDSSNTEDGAGTVADSPAENAAGPKIIFGKIDSDIGLAESAYVRRLIEKAELSGAEVLAIELNTFGGRVDAAVAIRDLLIDAPIETVVFINHRAISAGALISLACKHIAISPGGTIGAATPIVQAPGQELALPVEEKYLSYFREEMRSTAETRDRDPDIAEAMVDSDKVVEGVSEEGKLLTLSTKTALETGIADLEAESLEEALKAFGFNGTMESLDRSGSENLVSFLASAGMVSLLGFVMLFLAYMEYQTPGIGGFGFGALACFLLLYFGHYMVNLAGWEELLLFLFGLTLLLVELFVIPGFGVAGILGVLSILISFAMLLAAGDWSDFSFENPFTVQAVSQVFLTFLLSLIAIAGMIAWLPKSRSSPFHGRLVLQQELESADGFQSHDMQAEDLTGSLGKAMTPLRPSGRIRLDGRRLDVETEGDFVAAGESVRVVRHRAGRIIVRKV